MDLEKHKEEMLKTLTGIRDLCITAESYEEVSEMNALIEKTKESTTLEERTKILTEAMVYNTLAKQSYMKRNNLKE